MHPEEREKILLLGLLADAGLFLLYLLCAGLGVGAGKVLLALLTLAVSVLGLVILYLSKEIWMPRSRYLTAGFACIALCLVVSMMAHYPAPAAQSLPATTGPASTAVFFLPFL